jgi:short-subunit dehydrogenase
VITVLPGLTRTEFQAGAGMRDYHSPYRSADQVVQSTMNALGRKAIVVDGWMNKFLVHCTRLLPRSIVLAISRAVMRKEVAPELL